MDKHSGGRWILNVLHKMTHECRVSLVLGLDDRILWLVYLNTVPETSVVPSNNLVENHAIRAYLVPGTVLVEM